MEQQQGRRKTGSENRKLGREDGRENKVLTKEANVKTERSPAGSPGLKGESRNLTRKCINKSL